MYVTYDYKKKVMFTLDRSCPSTKKKVYKLCRLQRKWEEIPVFRIFLSWENVSLLLERNVHSSLNILCH